MAIEVVATTRKEQGTGASRRLRRAGKVPGIVYGGKAKQPVTIELEHNALFHALRNEKFHASILDLSLDGAKEQVLLRSFNMHPWKPEVQHIDFQRVSADEKIHMKVPLHFVNAEIADAVKFGGAIVSHVMNEVDIRCLPANLPEFIEVDLRAIRAGQSIHVKDLALPKGVEVVSRENPVIATAVVPRGAAEEESSAAEAAPSAANVPATKQAEKKEEAKPAAGGKAAPAAKPAAGGKK